RDRELDAAPEDVTARLDADARRRRRVVAGELRLVDAADREREGEPGGADLGGRRRRRRRWGRWRRRRRRGRRRLAVALVVALAAVVAVVAVVAPGAGSIAPAGPAPAVLLTRRIALPGVLVRLLAVAARVVARAAAGALVLAGAVI